MRYVQCFYFFICVCARSIATRLRRQRNQSNFASIMMIRQNEWRQRRRRRKKEPSTKLRNDPSHLAYI